MGSHTQKANLETYLQSNWTQTTIQFEGVPFNYNGLEKWISLKYVGVSNEAFIQGQATNGQLQVFCYSKNSPLCHKLADDVSTLLSCKMVSDVEVSIGQVQGSALNLDNGFFELLVTFEVNQYI